jgi:DNA-directed RNA polymerase subunit RPC12/RpoP
MAVTCVKCGKSVAFNGKPRNNITMNIPLDKGMYRKKCDHCGHVNLVVQRENKSLGPRYYEAVEE